MCVCRQTNTLMVRQGETACIECRSLAQPSPSVIIYHGATATSSPGSGTPHELGAPSRRSGSAVTRPGVGVQRYIDVAAGGVAVAAYSFPRGARRPTDDDGDHHHGNGGGGSEDWWPPAPGEVTRLRSGVYHCMANNSEATRRLRFSVRIV